MIAQYYDFSLFWLFFFMKSPNIAINHIGYNWFLR